MGSTITSGTIVSFGNTPQAKDDLYGFTEDQLAGVYCLDVMANDLGGNAKSLYSLDDAVSAGGSRPSDLLVQDAVGVVNYSHLGAKIWITAQGKVAYDATGLGLDALGAGETKTDTFTYAIKLGNGALSWATAAVQIVGQNDAATISVVGTEDTKVTEAGGAANGTVNDPNASGMLKVNDVDTGEDKFKTPASLAGTYGTFTFDPNSGAWTYALDQGKADKLTDGQHATDTLTVTSFDGTASHDIKIDITGSNDNATISVVAPEDTSVIEAGGVGNGTPGDPDASGTLKVEDVDAGENKFKTPASLDGTYGTFTFDANSGAWTYTLDESKADKLTDGQATTDMLTVKSYDGTASHDITINITGSNDDAAISVVAPEDTNVIEDGGIANGTAGDPGASGTLKVEDVDTGENKFKTPVSLDGTYGTFTFDADSGAWTYTLDEGKADKLTDGQHTTDSLTVASFDGTATHEIKIDITGSNDNATIVADGVQDTSVIEDGGVANGTPGDPDASGKLKVNDVDAGENKFQAPGSLDGTYGTFTFDPDSGEWTYTLDQGKADVLKDGEPANDTLKVTSADGTATYDITVDITGSNDDATISVVGAEDTKVVEAGGIANGTAGDPDASGTLQVSDVDAGENKFKTPASLDGTYGTFTFDPDSGAWTYTLDQDKADKLTDGEATTDTLKVTSFDGTASHDITVNITGSNDDAAIVADGVQDTSVVEDGGIANATAGDPDASGKLKVNDVDAGEDKFQTPASLDGTYGTFTFDANSGEWTYTLDEGKADALIQDEAATDKLTVTSDDGTATYDIIVDITGSNDDATISVVGTPDTTVVEAGGAANATPGDPDASGTLQVNDVDAGENKFQAPGSLDGTYGTFTFDPDSGEWTYTLDQDKADALTDGEPATDSLKVTSSDGTADYTITVDITGANDDATIVVDGTPDTTVVEDGGVANGTAGDPSASGTLKVEDVDAGENKFQTPGSLDGTYGTFTFDPNSGAWTYTLDQGKADKLTDGEATTDSLKVTSYDGTADYTITVDITGSNDNASIAPDGAQDTAVVEDGGVANGTTGDPSASGTLKVGDVDAGENKFQSPASLDGKYGTFTLNVDSGAWTYTLDQGKADKLTDGEAATDSLKVTSYDGTADYTITVDITGSNDNASIAPDGAQDTSVTEAGGTANGTPGDPDASGTLKVSDVDAGENRFQAPASLDGTYGTFTFDADSGAWTYTLDDGKADSLKGGEAASDTLKVTSYDGTATYDIKVDITGANDAPVARDDSYVTDEDVALTANGGGNPAGLLAHLDGAETADDTDVDGDDLDIAAVKVGATEITDGGAGDEDGTADGTITFKTAHGLVALDVETGAFTYASDPDYNGTDGFQYKATDGALSSDWATVDIKINAVNDKPVITSDGGGDEGSVSIKENTTAVTTVAASDPDGPSLKYSLDGGADASLFKIDETSGALSFASAPNFEALADANADNVYDVVVKVSDGTLSDTQLLHVTVEDVNEQPDAGTDFAVKAAENVSDTTVLADVDATDQDLGGGNDLVNTFENLSYSIVAGNGAGLFEIDSATGQVSLVAGKSLDYEAAQQYVLTVRATDGGSLFDDVKVTVNVTDVNEQPTLTVDLTPVTFAENTASGTALADVDGTDPDTLADLDADAGNNAFNDLTYSIQSGNGAGLFSINTSTGEISLAAGKSLDFETAQQHVLTVRVADGGGLFDEKTVTINVTDVNEQPTLTVDQTPVTFAENTASGTVLADVDGTDPDVGGGNDGTSNFEDLTYSIQSGNAAGLFSINTSTGEISLAAGKSLDFETAQQHILTVRVTDGGGLFDQKTVTINVTDVAENIAPVAASDALYVSDSTTATISVASLLANDSDVDGKSLTISSVSGASPGLSGLILNADGTVSFKTSNVGAESFSYTLSDNAGGTATGTVAVNVVSTNGSKTVDLSSLTYQTSYLDGGSNDDTLSGGTAPDIFIGGAADDILNGGAGNDILRGGAGNDSIDGKGGVDLIDFSDVSGGFTFTLKDGGSGTATVSGTDSYSGIEGVVGGAGNDTITGNLTDNVIRGGAGNDAIDGGGGLDAIDFSDGTAGVTFTVVQSSSNTVVNLAAAGLGTDTYKNIEGVTGTHFDDTLSGSSLKDLIQGGDGNDTISGNDGDDVITGGLGADNLAGGNGNDTFVYRGLGEGEDTISDFNTGVPGSGGDTLDISAVLDLPGNTWTDGQNLAFAVANGFVSFTDNGGHVQVNVDIDGTAGSGGASALAVLSNLTFTTAAAAQADLTDNIKLD